MKIKMMGAAIVVLAAVLWIASSMFGGYGKISENAYQLATATYGACMAKSSQRIDRAETLLEDETFVSGLTQQEVRWFRQIFDKARDNQWEPAARAVRQMMEDQVE